MIKNVDLSSKLGDLLNAPPISIELLPGDASEWLASGPLEHAPFLFVDNNLGVPHKLAYKAYLEAVARFRAVRPRHNASDSSPRDSTAELLTSSAVLLLVNPAHQTTLNARKRLVLLGTHPAPLELRFTAALLTLREGAKQSILWHHRRWLLRRIHPPLPSLSLSPSSSAIKSQWDAGRGDGVDSLHGVALPADAFRAEIGAVERACGAYPRNYHAWAHRFLCVEALVLSSFSPSRSPPSTFNSPCASDSSPQDKMEAMRELEEERARIRTWVERHVADYSAMQYACRLDALFRDLGLPGFDLPRTDGGKGAGPHALELVRTYPSHEALWLYVRGALTLSLFPPGTRGDADVAIDELAAKYIGEGAHVVPGTEDVNESHAHAVRFVAWRAWLRAGRRVDATVVRKIAAAAEREVKITSEGALLSYLSEENATAGDGRTEGV